MTEIAPAQPSLEGGVERAFRLLFWVFVGAMGFSLAGSALLHFVPAAMGVFGPYYATLVKIPTWTYMGLQPILPFLYYWKRLGWANSLVYLAWGSFIGLFAELLGTTTGVPFGAYSYTDWLGPKILDHVPYFIPPSWYAMSVLSYDLASRLGLGRLQRVLLVGLYLVLWDVALDPAMSTAFPFWHYESEGMLYRMPALNWPGWFVTGIAIGWGFDILAGTRPHGELKWVGWLWLLNGLFPLCLSLLYGLWAAVLFGILALPLPFLAIWSRRTSETT